MNLSEIDIKIPNFTNNQNSCWYKSLGIEEIYDDVRSLLTQEEIRRIDNINSRFSIEKNWQDDFSRNYTTYREYKSKVAWNKTSILADLILKFIKRIYFWRCKKGSKTRSIFKGLDVAQLASLGYILSKHSNVCTHIPTKNY